MNILSNVLGYFFGPKPEEETVYEVPLSFEETLKVLESSEDNVEAQEDEEIEIPNNMCFEASGKVTHIDTHYGIIDKTLYFETTNTKIAIGTTLQYLAYKKNGEIKISKILFETQDDWIDEVQNKEYDFKNTLQVSPVLQVVEREGRILKLSDSTEIDLNKVESDFIPMVGDFLSVKLLVEDDKSNINRCGRVLDVLRIYPLRCKQITGEIKAYDQKSKTGKINTDVFFNVDVCAPGYLPVLYDKVVVEVIESQNGSYNWRALKLIPLYANKKLFYVPPSITEEEELLKNKNDVVLPQYIAANLQEIGEKQLISIQINNTGATTQNLLNINFKDKNLILESPSLNSPINIKPKQSIFCKILCKGSVMGSTNSLIIFSFEGFSIGRHIKINIIPTYKPTKYYKNDDNNYGKIAWKKYQNSSKEIVPGQGPCKTPNFVKNRLQMYNIPDFFASKVYKLISEQKLEAIPIEEIAPVFKTPLSYNSYQNYFHYLLYLEEIALTVSIQKFDIPLACFIKDGEFLILEIQGLTERRPSLIVGDKIIACSPLGDNPQQFEGHIHKMGKSHVWLKFHPNFHSTYNGEDFRVQFQVSRSNLRRCHQAIDSASMRLGEKYLFPTKVDEKEPQIEFYCENEEETKNKEENSSKMSEDDLEMNSSSEKSSESLENETEALKTVKKKLKYYRIACKSLNSKNKGKNTSFEEKQKDNPDLKQEINHKIQQNIASFDQNFEENLFNQSNGDLQHDNFESGNHVKLTDNSKMSPNVAKNNSKYLSNKTEMNNIGQNDNFKLGNTVKLGENSTIDPNTPNKLVNKTNMDDIGHNNNFKSDNQAKLVNNSETDQNMAKNQSPKLTLQWFDPKLNYFQKEAVKNILYGVARPLPYLIFGPPGTGKTVTLIETILQVIRMIPYSRILVCTPSNSAADLITLRLLESNILDPGDMVRIVAHRVVLEGNIPDKLLPFCVTLDIAREGSRENRNSVTNGVRTNMQASQIGRHRITIGTCMAMSTLHTVGFPRGHFTHVIIDEAGQATEPEVMIPLSIVDIKTSQTVLAGDPRQLGPFVYSVLSKDNGLADSFFERIILNFPYARDIVGFPDTAGYDPRLVTQLVYNYRSLPELLTCPNNLFYNNELRPTISSQNSEEANLLLKVESILPKRQNRPPPSLIFYGVRGQNFQTPDCPSWYNPHEAGQVFHIINELYRLGIKSDEIGVISPYIKQGQFITNLLNECELDLPKIGSVEEFQGQEFKIVILSCVRSNEIGAQNDSKYGLGFISSPRRLNVAITRARALLFIVGNPHLLILDSYWRNVLKYAIKIDGYMGCDLPNIKIDS